MPLTQHEVVDKLGISRGTLHRVLTRSPLVKESTRSRILKELERLNYTPNAIARGLKTRRTHSIGLIGPAAIKMSNIHKLNALHQEARRHGYSVIFGYSDGSSEEEAKCIQELRSRMVDGFVALGRGLAASIPHYQTLITAGVPLVTLYPIPGLDVDCVHVDTRRAFYELTSHLIGLGHTDIGILLDASLSQYSINRELGFQDAMTKAKLKINHDWVIRVTPDGMPAGKGENDQKSLWEISDYQFGFWGASLLFAKRKRPTAVVCFSDEYAVGALRAADVAGISVPDELAVVGYDDKEPARFARVPLTTMHQPDEKQGHLAISLLLDRINGKLPAKPVVHPLAATLVVRESSGIRRSKESRHA